MTIFQLQSLSKFASYYATLLKYFGIITNTSIMDKSRDNLRGGGVRGSLKFLFFFTFLFFIQQLHSLVIHSNTTFYLFSKGLLPDFRLCFSVLSSRKMTSLSLQFALINLYVFYLLYLRIYYFYLLIDEIQYIHTTTFF